MPRVSSPTPVSYGLTQLMLKVMKDFPLIKRGIWSDPEGTRAYFYPALKFVTVQKGELQAINFRGN